MIAQSSSIKVKFFVIALYVYSNIWAGLAIIEENKLIGDYAGWAPPKTDQIYVALLLIVGTYISMLFFKNKNCKHANNPTIFTESKALSIAIFFLQILFFLFILLYSAGGAGDTSKAGGVFRFIFYIINPDMLFYVYYSVTMYSKKSGPFRSVNLIIFLISNLARGWIGPLIFIFFIAAISKLESSQVKVHKLKSLISMLGMSVVFIISSYLLYLKTALREGLDVAMLILTSLNFFDVISSFFEILFSRLQLISNVSFQIAHKEELTQFIENGILGNFFSDGIIQQTFFKIFGMDPGENINLFIWKYYIAGNYYQSETTFNNGIVSWLYILPYYWILPFLLYIISLLYLTNKLAKYIGGNGVRHLTWFVVLVYIIPGWLGAYISLIWSILIFVIIAKITHFAASNLTHGKNLTISNSVSLANIV